MTRISNFKFQFSNLLVVLVIIGSIGIIRVSAQSPTGTADQLRDSVKQKVAQELAQIKQAVAKKAFVGSITGKSDATITISTFNNQTRSVTVTTDAVIKLLNGKDGTPADLKVGDYVLVMGDVDSQNVMTAKRLLVISKPAPDNRKVIFATVTAFTSTSLTVKSTDNTVWTLKITSATKFGPAKTKFADIDPGAKIVVIGTTMDTTTLTAKQIFQVVSASTPTPTH